MKRLFYLSALAIATLIGFASCEEEEEVDIRDQAIGTYDIKISQYYSIDSKLYTMESIFKNLGEELADLSFTATATLTKDGDGLKMTTNESDPESWTLVKIGEASNGFTFDIENWTIEIDDAGTKVTFSNYNGYKLGDVSYNGAYINGKLEFYLKDANDEFEDYIWAQIINDEEAMKTFNERIKGTELEKIFTDGTIVFIVSCTKK